MTDLVSALTVLSSMGKWGGWAALAMLLAALWKGLPSVQREITARRAMERDGETVMREELREALKEMREHSELIEERLAAAEAQQSRNLTRISNLSFILQMVMGELRRVSPDSVVLFQAENLLQADREGNI